MTYIMSSTVRTFALTTHISVSVGWVGAVAAYLALAVTGLTSHDDLLVRAAYLAMEVTAWYVIVPLAFATLLTGLVMSLGTRWGLFRHYWVLLSLLLTIAAIVILLTQLEHISYAADVAANPTTSSANLRGAGGQVLHSGGGLVVLLVITALNVYKPRGLTPYGWRKLQEQRMESQAQ